MSKIKLKSHSGAKKRFHIKGKKQRVKRRCSNRNHILTKKPAKRMMRLRGLVTACAPIAKLARLIVLKKR